MKRPYPLLLLSIFFSCSDESTSLVQKYTLAWETDLGSVYSKPEPLPGKSVGFLSLIEIQDGFVTLASTSMSPVGPAFIIKTDFEGNVIKDFEIPDEHELQLCKSQNGGFYVTSIKESNGAYRVRSYSASLDLISTQELNMDLPTFAKILFVPDGLIRLRSDDTSIEKFDFSGQLLWKKQVSEFGFDNFINPIVALPKNSSELTLFAFQHNSLQLAHINSSNGLMIWRQGYAYTDKFDGLSFNFNLIWGKNDKLYFSAYKMLKGKICFTSLG